MNVRSHFSYFSQQLFFASWQFTSMSQKRIDQVFGCSSAQVGQEVLDVQVAVAGACRGQINEEIAREQEAEQVGKEFIKNGSRDRWGNLRANVGGRPRKRPLSPEGPGAPEEVSPKKSDRKNKESYAGRHEKFITTMQNRSIQKEFPHFKRSAHIKAFLATEDRSKEIVVKNALGRDLTNPGRRSRAFTNSIVKRIAGQTPGMGYRAAG